MKSSRSTIELLGYAGLVPFVVPALTVALGTEYADMLTRAAGIYAFGIICFLTGSWWGLSLMGASGRALVFSNLYFLLAFALYLFAFEWWGLAASVLLVSIFFAEQNTAMLPALPAHYRKMRAVLTLVASASMLSLQFFA